MPRQNKMMQLVNCRLRIILQDGRVFIGQMLAFDKHMNLVLADCEEYRTVRSAAAKKKKLPKVDDASEDVLAEEGSAAGKKEMRRTLGLVILRGETVVSVNAESGPPPAGQNRARVPASMQTGQSATFPMMAPGARPGMPMSMPPPGSMPMYVRPGMPMIPPPGAPYHMMPGQMQHGMSPYMPPGPPPHSQ